MVLLIPLLVAIFLSINMGGSGTAPAFAATYGAKIVKKESIPFMFGAFVLLGAVVAGDKVIKTIGGAVLPAEQMNVTVVTIVLLASALSIFAANLLKVPQSTSQSTIFGLVGCALPLHQLQSGKLLYEMVPTWLIMPLISFVLAYGLGYFLIKTRNKLAPNDFKVINNNKH
jgi:sulfate permease